MLTYIKPYLIFRTYCTLDMCFMKFSFLLFGGHTKLYQRLKAVSCSNQVLYFYCCFIASSSKLEKFSCRFGQLIFFEWKWLYGWFSDTWGTCWRGYIKALLLKRNPYIHCWNSPNPLVSFAWLSWSWFTTDNIITDYRLLHDVYLASVLASIKILEDDSRWRHFTPSFHASLLQLGIFRR